MALYCKRDDLYAFDPASPLQGNKVRKLRPYLAAPEALRGRTIVSFGGAYSNHLAALSAAGRRFGFFTRFLVRGEPVSNPTLDYIRANGSDLRFVSRSDYRRKNDPEFLQALSVGPQDLVIPEGGGTAASLIHAGAPFSESVVQLGRVPDYFCLSAGTGCTAAGIVAAAEQCPAKIEVFPALRGDWMRGAIEAWMGRPIPANKLEVVKEFTFGGYGKFPGHWKLYTPPGCLAKRADVGMQDLPPLDPVYTAKLFVGVLERIRLGAYPRKSTVVVLHTGGIY